MSGFSTPFRHYLPHDTNTLRLAVTTGLIVLDTNVLLSAYRFAPAARAELISVIEHISDRVWVPHRVAEEFHQNRLQVIADYDAAYLPVLESLTTAQEALDDDLGSKIARLANRAALSEAQKLSLLELVRGSTAAAASATEDLRREHGLADLRGHDAILAKFQQLLEDRTGLPLSEVDMADAINEAKRRIEHKIPPGYQDAKKADPHGDFIVWKQTLLEVGARGVPHIVFVTSDSKEDWYQVVKGKTIGGRPELTKEMADATGAELVMMTVTSLLFHAKNYLKVNVSPETIRQSEILPRRKFLPEMNEKKNELRGKKLRDTERLESRIATRQALIAALREALEDRIEEDPDCESPETIALQRHLEESENSERILRRRYDRILAEVDDQSDQDSSQLTKDASLISANMESEPDQRGDPVTE